MVALRGKIKNGQVVLERPAELPDDTEVIVTTADGRDDEPMSSEEIANIAAAMDRFEPLELSEAEWARWEADRQEQKVREIEQFDQTSELLRRMWDDAVPPR
jgi:hypothetical protein